MASFDRDQVHATLLRGRTAIVALSTDVSDDAWRWRPAEGTWSLLEVVNHLADEELDDFPRRIDLLINHPGAAWPPIDPEGWCRERRYNERDPAESLQRFVAAREGSLQWWDALGQVDWNRTYEHASGPLRAGDVLLSWMVHDQLHARQMLRLHHQRTLLLGPEYAADYAGAW
jgi:hypothetical protein